MVAFEHLTTSGDTASNGAVYTTASVAPAANRVVFLAVLADGPAGVTPTTPTVTGLGLTWTLTRQTPDPSNGVRTLFWMRATTGGTAPTPGTVTINFGAQTLVVCQWAMYAAANADLADPVVQSIEERRQGNTNTNVSFPFTNPLTPGNGTLAVVGIALNTTITAGTGWTSPTGGQSNLSTPTQSLMGMYANAGATPVAASWSGTTNSWTIAIEVRAASAGTQQSGEVMAASASAVILGGKNDISGTVAKAAAGAVILSGKNDISGVLASAASGALLDTGVVTRTASGAVPMSATPTASVGPVRSQVATLGVSAGGALIVSPGGAQSASWAPVASSSFVVAGSKAISAVLTARGTSSLTVGAVRSQLGVVGVRATPALVIATQASGLLVATAAPRLTVASAAGSKSSTLTMSALAQMLMVSTSVAIDWRPHSQFTSTLEPSDFVALLDPSGGTATIVEQGALSILETADGLAILTPSEVIATIINQAADATIDLSEG